MACQKLINSREFTDPKKSRKLKLTMDISRNLSKSIGNNIKFLELLQKFLLLNVQTSFLKFKNVVYSLLHFLPLLNHNELYRNTLIFFTLVNSDTLFLLYFFTIRKTVIFKEFK